MKSTFIKTTIALVISLLFATQASAYEIATPVNPTGNAWEWGNSTQWNTTFSYPIDTTYFTKQQNGAAIFIQKNGSTASTGKFVLNSVKSSNPITFKKGNYYSTILNFSLQSGSLTEKGLSMPSINRINLPNNAPYKVMSISSSYVPCASPSGSGGTSYDGYCSYGGVSWNIIVQATRDDVGVFQLGLPNTDMVEWIVVNLNSNNMGTILVEPITEFEALKGADTINQQQQEAGEQAQQDGQQGSNQAQSDADTNTATMFQTVGNILGAITDTPAGDCSLNGNMGNLDLGNLNLCQAEIEPIRPIIRAVLYLVMALATYKIMIWVIGAIAGLINWVQTGNDSKETEVNNG